MRHLRKDYDAIQPWPTKRPHLIREYDEDGGSAVVDATEWPEDHIGESFSIGFAAPIIPDDEPVFLLRAHDPVAAEVVRTWADLAETAGTDLETCDRVRKWADEMAAYWSATSRDKLAPDVPQGMLR